MGITHGDINGIGYEIILKTLSQPGFGELCTPIVYGSSKALSYHRKALEMANVNFNLIKSASDAITGANNLIEILGDDVKIELGVASDYSGKAAFASLERAVADLKNNEIDVLVTAPINKDAIQSESFHFPGHTEYLEACADGSKSLMILCNDNIRVALVTTHLPISRISSALSKDLIVEKIKIFNE